MNSKEKNMCVHGSGAIPVGSPEQMRDIDWPVLRMWSFFDPAFSVGQARDSKSEVVGASVQRRRASADERAHSRRGGEHEHTTGDHTVWGSAGS